MAVFGILTWVFTALLLVLLIACIAASRGTLPLNHLFGVRFPALMRNEAAWRTGHAACILPAAVCFALALVCSLVGLAVPAVHIVTVAVFAGAIVWVGVRGSRAAEAA
ncbi:SdpI family protein [Microbacterium sp. AZCO]|uniref:SdpI family protein n=1 Tax=Microbacterium sp. AZCO TaxID=3142976 RepID=UPI0031F340AB